MKVHELIEILEDLDPDAEVLIMSQENWPFENSLAGVAVREEMHREDDDEDEDDADYGEGLRPNDVFLCEGRQLRYGNKNAWNVARRD